MLRNKVRRRYYSLGLNRRDNVLIGRDHIVKFKKNDFYRGHYKFSGDFLFGNEIRFLNLLSKHEISPKIEFEGKNYFVQRNVGFPITKGPITDDIINQILNIITVLEDENIQHRDIKFDNLLLLNGKVKLIDFEWACENNAAFTTTIDLLDPQQRKKTDRQVFEGMIERLNE